MTLEEWERRGGERNLALEERGVWYRITDYHIVRNLDVPRVNYQAVEMTDHEVQVVLADRAASISDMDLRSMYYEDIRAAEPPPEPESESESEVLPVQASSEDPDSFEWPATGRKPSNPAYRLKTEEHPQGVPGLSVWARDHGWKGVGAIPNAVKMAYSDEFGIPQPARKKRLVRGRSSSS